MHQRCADGKRRQPTLTPRWGVIGAVLYRDHLHRTIEVDVLVSVVVSAPIIISGVTSRSSTCESPDDDEIASVTWSGMRTVTRFMSLPSAEKIARGSQHPALLLTHIDTTAHIHCSTHTSSPTE
jgi:hypothetical protein